MTRKKITSIITWAVVAATLASAAYIMANKLGLSDKLDFGAGAYYYADIPNFDKYMKSDYSTEVPMWVHITLFLGWGYLMFRLWVWLEERNKK